MAGYVSIRLCHCWPELSFWQVALGETLRGFVCWQTRTLEILSCKTSSTWNSPSKVSAGHEHVALSENCVPEIILKLVVRFETCVKILGCTPACDVAMRFGVAHSLITLDLRSLTCTQQPLRVVWSKRRYHHCLHQRSSCAADPGRKNSEKWWSTVTRSNPRFTPNHHYSHEVMGITWFSNPCHKISGRWVKKIKASRALLYSSIYRVARRIWTLIPDLWGNPLWPRLLWD